ncbi:MAG: ABC-2 family transporter protein [Patescibacteria group bacterium]|jgi:ABC-2 type transport system permease protein
MRKYFQIFKVTLNEYFVYRLNFILWRVRMVMGVVIIYFFWWSIFADRVNFLGYTAAQMMTYVLMTNIVGAIIFASKTVELAGQILNGDIINFLLKPISFLRYLLSRELADKGINAFFACFEILFLILVFKPEIFIQTDLSAYFFFLAALIIGVVIHFFFSFMISLLAFWTPEVWAPRFIFWILMTMLAGAYFPIDVLPKPIYYLLLLTPFPYLTFLPAKIYLTGMTSDLLIPFVLGVLWVFIMYFLARYVWRKGLREFSFYGR